MDDNDPTQLQPTFTDRYLYGLFSIFSIFFSILGLVLQFSSFLPFYYTNSVANINDANPNNDFKIQPTYDFLLLNKEFYNKAVSCTAFALLASIVMPVFIGLNILNRQEILNREIVRLVNQLDEEKYFYCCANRFVSKSYNTIFLYVTSAFYLVFLIITFSLGIACMVDLSNNPSYVYSADFQLGLIQYITGWTSVGCYILAFLLEVTYVGLLSVYFWIYQN